jgi:subtilisin family serine protease
MAQEANIIRAIYYAVDHNASVINMSCELPQISDAMMKAINYATRNGVMCVASAGNNASTALVCPAGFGNVVSVDSLSPLGQPSTFSNYGPDLVQIAAPGEGLITTYPGRHYAQVWGSSFSAALVSGSTSVLLQQTNNKITNQIQVGEYSARSLKRRNVRNKRFAWCWLCGLESGCPVHEEHEYAATNQAARLQLNSAPATIATFK